MQKFWPSLFLVCACALSLAGCGSRQSTGTMSIDEEYPQGGFINPAGAQMLETPEGYYAFRKNYLYYITPDLQKSIVLCNKPECLHDKTDSQDFAELYKCDAYFRYGNLSYYDNHLYIVSSTPDSINASIIYKVSMDGTEKNIFYEAPGNITGFCIYKGNVYISENFYKKSGQTTSIKKVPLNDPENAQILFETKEYPESTLNRMDCYGDYLYFYFLPSQNGNGLCYYRVNIETGESEVLFDCKGSGAFLYMNDYGCIVDDQIGHLRDENNKNGEVFFDSTYYKIAPGSTKAEPLTEEEFPILAKKPVLRNMDDKYVYFASPTNFTLDESWPDDASIYVCTYDGKLAATIPMPREDFVGVLYYVLPGNDDYMFVQIEKINANSEVVNHFYYAPKSEFNGGTVQLKEIPME